MGLSPHGALVERALRHRHLGTRKLSVPPTRAGHGAPEGEMQARAGGRHRPGLSGVPCDPTYSTGGSETTPSDVPSISRAPGATRSSQASPGKVALSSRSSRMGRAHEKEQHTLDRCQVRTGWTGKQGAARPRNAYDSATKRDDEPNLQNNHVQWKGPDAEGHMRDSTRVKRPEQVNRRDRKQVSGCPGRGEESLGGDAQRAQGFFWR